MFFEKIFTAIFNNNENTKMVPNWSPKRPEWTPEQLSLFPSKIPVSKNVSLNTILQKSDNFHVKFPTESPRCKTLRTKTVPDETLTRNINSTYPIVHENILQLFAEYILLKRQHGNSIEKSVYKDMNLVEFMDRLLTKRAVYFYGVRDLFMTQNGTKGSLSWETIGTLKEKEPLTLKNCLSYEEIKLSAFFSVSSYTHFLNVGDRKNKSVYEERRDRVQEEGVIVGIIGPRLVKKNLMDYQELIINESQNIRENGYGGNVEIPTVHQLFSKLYEEKGMEFGEVEEQRGNLPKNDPRFTVLQDGIFDNFVYYKRLLFSFDTLLMEANQRAALQNTTAFLHVVGFGLGVWMKSETQVPIFMESFLQRIQALGGKLRNVSDIRFSYIDSTCGTYQNGDLIPIEGHPLNGIRIYIDRKNPHEKLAGTDQGKLLVVSYAWDGNALPGNEFWNKYLGSSGDSAAASSTQISELHNPFINPKVSAGNTVVVTAEGLQSIAEYIGAQSRKTQSSGDSLTV